MDDAPHAGAMLKFGFQLFVADQQFPFGGLPRLFRAIALEQRAGVTLLRRAFALLAQDPDGFEGR